MWLIGSLGTWGMFGLGMLMLTAILLRRSSRYQKQAKRAAAKPPQPRMQARSRQSDSEPLLDAPPSVLQWQVEMHELTRELKAEIDSKMIALQLLTRQAGEQAERLETAVRRAENWPGLPADPLEAIAELGHPSEIPELDIPPANAAGSAVSPLGHQETRAVHSLNDAGHSVEAIAEKLGAAVGDVEWVLSLGKQSS